MSELRIRIDGRNMPRDWCREHGVTHVGITRAKEVIDVVSTEEEAAVFTLAVDVVRKDDGLDFRGPYVNGRRGERFLYLNWGHLAADDQWGGGVRRVKLQLLLVDPALVETGLDGRVLVGDLDLSDAQGTPVCATVRAPRLRWRVE